MAAPSRYAIGLKSPVSLALGVALASVSMLARSTSCPSASYRPAPRCLCILWPDSDGLGTRVVATSTKRWF
ncbi:hypothetical protein B0H19DRAFT_1142203 [Mycena capillaripes]|nr:hypothetical protein B0H19DRAFT_1142203 [Mycena capillaripes]